MPPLYKIRHSDSFSTRDLDEPLLPIIATMALDSSIVRVATSLSIRNRRPTVPEFAIVACCMSAVRSTNASLHICRRKSSSRARTSGRSILAFHVG